MRVGEVDPIACLFARYREESSCEWLVEPGGQCGQVEDQTSERLDWAVARQRDYIQSRPADGGVEKQVLNAESMLGSPLCQDEVF